jgi:predicted RNA-binding protein with PUA-like domain
MQYWLVKSEPEAYSWAQFVKDGKAAWTGVRNFQARNNLRAMKRGDLVLFYHSVTDKQIVGIARVTKADGKEVANEIAQDSQFSLTLAKVAAGAVVVITVTARNSAGESPAGDAVEIMVP